MTSFIKASASFLDDMDDISGFLGIGLCSLIIMRSVPSWNVGVLLAPSHFSRVVMGQNFGRISSLRKELAILNLSSIYKFKKPHKIKGYRIMLSFMLLLSYDRVSYFNVSYFNVILRYRSDMRCMPQLKIPSNILFHVFILSRDLLD